MWVFDGKTGEKTYVETNDDEHMQDVDYEPQEDQEEVYVEPTIEERIDTLETAVNVLLTGVTE